MLFVVRCSSLGHFCVSEWFHRLPGDRIFFVSPGAVSDFRMPEDRGSFVGVGFGRVGIEEGNDHGTRACPGYRRNHDAFILDSS